MISTRCAFEFALIRKESYSRRREEDKKERE